MANKAELLAQYLLMKQILKHKDYEGLEAILDKLIKTLDETKDGK